MNRPATTLVTVLLLVVASVAVPTAALAQSNATATATPTPDEPTATPTPDESADEPNDTANASAGELLQGVIGVQEAEIDGEIRTRSFGIRVARAESADAKADVVAEELEDVEARLDELERRKQRLERAREAGNVSRGEYRAEMAKLAAETRTTQRLANESADVAADLPADVRERKGINVTAIRTLAERADELSGPEVSRIARSIAGPAAGADLSERPEQRGSPSNETRRGTDRPTNRTSPDGDRTTTGGDGAGDGNRTRTADGTATPTPTSPDGTQTETESGSTDGDRGARSTDGA